MRTEPALHVEPGTSLAVEPSDVPGLAPTTARRTEPGASRLALVALAVAVATPFVNALGAFAHGWVPYGDDAIITTRAYDVGTRLTPLLGMPSTFGDVSRFNPAQPGPLQFWLLAPFVRLLGPSAGPLIGTAAVNAAAIFVVGIVLWRRAGRGASVAGGAACLLAAAFISSLGNSFLVINSVAPLVPLVATLVLAWAVADGGLVWLAPLFAFGSFTAQGDLEFVGVVIIVVVWAVASLCVARWRARHTERPHATLADRYLRKGVAPVAISLAVLFVCWLGPVADAAHHHGGNLREIVDAFFAPVGLLGLTGVDRALGATLNLPPFSLGAQSEARWAAGLNLTAVVLLGLLAALSWWALRERQQRSVRRLLATAWVTILAVAVNGYRIPVATFDSRHTVFAQGATAFLWLTVTVVGFRWLGLTLRRSGTGSAPRPRSLPTVVASAFTLVLAAVLCVPVGTGDTFLPWSEKAVPALASQVERNLPSAAPTSTVVIVTSGGGEKYRLELQGLVAQLRSNGVSFLVQDPYGSTYGPGRTLGANAGTTAGMVTLLPTFATSLPPGARVVARWNPPGWDRGAEQRLDQEVDAFVRRSGGLRLTPTGADGLAEVLRFAVPAQTSSGEPIDTSPFMRDPSRLLDVPGVLTNLYQEGWVASPALPAGLQRRIDALSRHGMAMIVWFIPGPLAPSDAR